MIVSNIEVNMKQRTPEEIAELVKAAQDIINDPEKYKKFQQETEDFLADFNKGMKELQDQIELDNKKWAQENPEQAQCDHGVIFDKDEALKLIEKMPIDPSLDAGTAFIIGSPASLEIRKRWPRLAGSCPKGCGFNGIAYASYEHYIYGDW